MLTCPPSLGYNLYIYTHTQPMRKIKEGVFPKYLNTFVGVYPTVVYFRVRVKKLLFILCLGLG
jgi:hypothetical protein